MNLIEAIEARRSRRKYLGTPIDSGAVSTLRELAAEYSAAGNARMELVLNDGEAFRGFRKSYGMFSGVNDYAGLIAGKGDAVAAERLGYYGELLILRATAMGLGTCWVGMGRSDLPFSLSENEKLVCTIILGNAAEKDSFKERLIRGVAHRKTKSAREMFAGDSPPPDWFMRGMKAVEKAPSAMNRQPVMFSWKDGKASAAVDVPAKPSGVLDASLLHVDFGIAKLHFEIGAGGGKWKWGNGGGFER